MLLSLGSRRIDSSSGGHAIADVHLNKRVDFRAYLVKKIKLRCAKSSLVTYDVFMRRYLKVLSGASICKFSKFTVNFFKKRLM